MTPVLQHHRSFQQFSAERCSWAPSCSSAGVFGGRLATVTVKEGDQVAAGDAVARLTLPEIEAKVAQAKALHEAAAAKADMAQEGARTEELDAARADLARARAGEHLARVTNTRVAALFKDGLVSTQKRDEAAAQLKASSELAAAAAAKVTALENGARPRKLWPLRPPAALLKPRRLPAKRKSAPRLQVKSPAL